MVCDCLCLINNYFVIVTVSMRDQICICKKIGTVSTTSITPETVNV